MLARTLYVCRSALSFLRPCYTVSRFTLSFISQVIFVRVINLVQLDYLDHLDYLQNTWPSQISICLKKKWRLSIPRLPFLEWFKTLCTAGKGTFFPLIRARNAPRTVPFPQSSCSLHQGVWTCYNRCHQRVPLSPSSFLNASIGASRKKNDGVTLIPVMEQENSRNGSQTRKGPLHTLIYRFISYSCNATM